MESNRDYYTVIAMVKFGGSFIQSLGGAAQHADHVNLKKIKNTWPEYWSEYERMGIKLESEDGENKLNY